MRYTSSLQSNMTMAALKLMIEVEQALTGSTRLKRILFDCCWLVSSVIVITCPEECGSTRVWSNVIALPLSATCGPALMYVAHCVYTVSDIYQAEW